MSEAGIHHVTAFAGPAARNREFYTRTLGLRLVKTTVNFDDPGTYHLYYGDEDGTPGTIVTFFPIEQAGPGRAGVGETSETAFRVAKTSLKYWTKRFVDEQIAYEPLVQVFGESVLRFKDPDGMSLSARGSRGRSNGAGLVGRRYPRGTHDPWLSQCHAAPQGDRSDSSGTNRCSRLRGSGSGRLGGPLHQRRRVRQRRDPAQGRRISARESGCWFSSPRRVSGG